MLGLIIFCPERRADHVTISADGRDRESPVGHAAGIAQASGQPVPREPSPSASAYCPAPHDAQTGAPSHRGSAPVRLAVPAAARGAGGDGHRAARNRPALASGRLPSLLALEVALTTWSTQSGARGARPDPADEPGEPAVGCTPDPRRAAQAWGRGRPVHRGEVHGQAPTTADAELGNL